MSIPRYTTDNVDETPDGDFVLYDDIKHLLTPTIPPVNQSTVRVTQHDGSFQDYVFGDEAWRLKP